MGAQVATPLAVALNELVQNAVEHGFAGRSGQLPEPLFQLASPPLRAAAPAATGGAADGARSADGEIGQAEVHVSFLRRGDELSVQVRDNGTGLPPGFSIDNTTSLGLSIVRGLVNSQLGGKIEMYNDGGAVAELTVPVDRAESNDLARL